jgi:hypothetical protein
MGAHNVSDFQCRPHENAGLLFGIVDGSPQFGYHRPLPISDHYNGLCRHQSIGFTPLSQQELNFPEIRPRLQQMDGEGMTVRTGLLDQTGAPGSFT